MKIHKKHIAYTILLMFFVYGLDNFIFERQFFFNEILSLLGVIFFAKEVLFKQQNGVIRIPTSPIYKLIVYTILLGCFHLLISIFTKTNWYFYFRSSVIFYSIFSFFVGFYLYPYLEGFIIKIRRLLILYMSYALIFPSILLLERFMGTVFFPFWFTNKRFISLILLVILDILLAIRYESLTVVIVTFLLLILIFIPNYTYFKAFSIAVTTCFLIFFIAFIPAFKKYETSHYSLFGSIRQVSDQHFLLRLDGNSTWRAVFWYRITVENFPQNVVGIGFGTPLLAYKKGADSVESDFDDEHDIHVMGCHNTYLTVATRMGILFWIFLIYMYRSVFKDFYKYRSYYNQNIGDYWLIISFLSVSIVGLFNLVLESPTGASLYWMGLGLVAQAIEKRKKSLEQV
ncbi:hypothetical protein AD998_13805 [bacterium 336/3]|nr:hypothetical protein AD998_13805 [bacterium 336/3]